MCDTFVQFAGETYGVPPRFVPETYAEFAFSTTTGVPVIASVGKYVLQNANQRRLVLVGDMGQAILDLSHNILAVAEHDSKPDPISVFQNLAESKYRAVLLASLGQLHGKPAFKFDDRDVALRANEWILDLHSRDRKGQSQKTYRQGMNPSHILSQQVFVCATDDTRHSRAISTEQTL